MSEKKTVMNTHDLGLEVHHINGDVYFGNKERMLFSTNFTLNIPRLILPKHHASNRAKIISLDVEVEWVCQIGCIKKVFGNEPSCCGDVVPRVKPTDNKVEPIKIHYKE